MTKTLAAFFQWYRHQWCYASLRPTLDYQERRLGLYRRYVCPECGRSCWLLVTMT
ncbi:MAG TPA: hypothetical protein VFT66_15755 [Roseiflexaceae bacterium]|nr:hypothetical protein [Roseiflexaceae bacterium]